MTDSDTDEDVLDLVVLANLNSQRKFWVHPLWLQKHRFGMFGFIKSKNTNDAISEFIRSVCSTANNQRYSAGIFCDLKKAFDTVDHQILIKKLGLCGVRGTPLNWFRSYLSDRFQCVEVCNSRGKGTSNLAQVSKGVPQGSILGPLLFLIYVNDLSQNINGYVIQYADDTSVLVSADSPSELSHTLNTAVKDLNKWFRANHLHLNFEKTSIMHFRPHRNHLEVSSMLGDCSVSESNSVCFLGLNIDPELAWPNHIESLSYKLNKCLYSLRYLSEFLNKKSLKLVYHGYFVSIMSYGLMSWGTTSSSAMLRVFKLQKRAVRLVCGMGSRDSCRPVFPREGLMTLPSLFIYFVSIYTFHNLFSFTVSDHKYSTRNKTDLIIPQHRIHFFRKSVEYQGPKIFNNLPETIKSIKSENSFKSKLKSFLIKKAFYSVNEFFENR